MWFFFCEGDFDNSALGSFPECSFIPSRVDNGDFGRGRPYNLIRFSIIHRDIPLPWRGVRVPAHGRGGLSIRGIRGFSFVHEVLEKGDSGILQGEENAQYFLFKWFLMIRVRVFFHVVIFFLPVLTI